MNAMLLNLGDVMAHVIDDIQSAIPPVLLAKCLAQPLSQSRAVGEGVVTGSLHCIKVCRPLTAVNWGGCKLAVKLDAEVEGLDEAAARQLVETAHQVCPYSNAVRGNIDVDLTTAVL